MISFKHLINRFTNSGDVFYSKSMNVSIGLSIEEIIKLLRATDLNQAKKVEDINEICKMLYGEALDTILSKDGFDEISLWVDMKDRLRQQLSQSINVDQLDEELESRLQSFFKLLDKKEYDEARTRIQDIADGYLKDERAISFKMLLQADYYICKEQYENAYLEARNSIKINFTNSGFIGCLNLLLGYLNRPDLAIELINEYKSNLELIDSDSALNVIYLSQITMIQNGNLDEAEKIHNLFFENIVKDTGESSTWTIYFKNNYVSLALKSYKFFVDEESTKRVLQFIEDVGDYFKEYRGEGSIELAKSYYGNKAYYYLQLFRSLFHAMLTTKTMHQDGNIAEYKLKDDIVFLKVNYFDPLEYLEASRDLMLENIKIKEHVKELGSLGQSIVNLGLIYMEMINLKLLLKWKVGYMCEKFDLDLNENINDLRGILGIHLELEALENCINDLDSGITEKSYTVSRFYTELGDFYGHRLEDKVKSKEFYAKAIRSFPEIGSPLKEKLLEYLTNKLSEL